MNVKTPNFLKQQEYLPARFFRHKQNLTHVNVMMIYCFLREFSLNARNTCFASVELSRTHRMTQSWSTLSLFLAKLIMIIHRRALVITLVPFTTAVNNQKIKGNPSQIFKSPNFSKSNLALNRQYAFLLN